jgi:hypothetical protein
MCVGLAAVREAKALVESAGWVGLQDLESYRDLGAFRLLDHVVDDRSPDAAILKLGEKSHIAEIEVLLAELEREKASVSVSHPDDLVLPMVKVLVEETPLECFVPSPCGVNVGPDRGSLDLPHEFVVLLGRRAKLEHLQ